MDFLLATVILVVKVSPNLILPDIFSTFTSISLYTGIASIEFIVYSEVTPKTSQVQTKPSSLAVASFLSTVTRESTKSFAYTTVSL